MYTKPIPEPTPLLRMRLQNRYKEQPDGCWLWSASLDNTGYGQFVIKKFPYKAHRVAWVWKNGPVPEGLELDHLCRNRACCNPAHMEPVTRGENIRRGWPYRRCNTSDATPT